MRKEIFRDADGSQKISHISFGMMSDEEMQKASHLSVVNRELYQGAERSPIPFGVLDRRLGTSSKSLQCDTCGEKMADCPGHFGDIQLELPVFHVGYFKAITTILQNICKSCSKVLLSREDRQFFLTKLRNPLLEALQKKAILKKINEKCRRQVTCLYCGSRNGVVKKIALLKLSHEVFRGLKDDHPLKKEFEGSFGNFVPERDAKDLQSWISKAQDDLNPLKVLRLFEKIPNEDVELLGLDPVYGRPDRLILTRLLVPPVCIRPSIAMDAGSGSNEDDLTIKLMEIIFINSSIRKHINSGVQFSNLMEDWDFLQLQCGLYINGDLNTGTVQAKPIRGFCQRLKGKTGRFRGNLSGKRVDFSGRTVISPDPNLRIDQVAIPIHVAKILTFPERVTEHNINKMKALVRAGPDKYPGANYVESFGPNGVSNKKYLKYARKIDVANSLQYGDIVERHLEEGDIVLFNRQPSLHKLSIMSHFVKISPFRTFRFNECVCTPYNADFDGDEMNLHVPQTQEARAEALVLMGVKSNMITPRNGEPLIAAIQDFITGAYLLSRKDMFFDRAQFSQLCAYLSDGNLKIDIPPPAILKPMRLWTGKQVFSVLFRPNKDSNVRVNLRTANRNYSKKGEDMCPNDGFVVIRNSELMCGYLDKAILGSGSKNTVFFVLLRDYNEQVAADAMSRVAKLCSRWLMNFGFSIGISDVMPTDSLLKSKANELLQGETACKVKIEEFNQGRIVTQPGCTAEQTMEAVINKILSDIREALGKDAVTTLEKSNAALCMALSGSKGSNINISQMIACVGQQTVSGARIPNGFEDRALPHFPKKSRTPKAKGFVSNSFYTGLTPTEFFFHTMGGREGLVDTAVKTAETGYMQRRLMKALEDLSSQYDTTVRDSVGGIVQLTYGDDNLDPACMEGSNKPLDFKRVMASVIANFPCYDESPLYPYQLLQLSAEMREALVRDNNWSQQFAKEFSDFLDDTAKKLAELRARHDLSPMLVRDEKLIAREVNEILNSKNDGATRINALSVSKIMRFTETQLKQFIEICVHKYKRATVEPGTAVGAVGAQSIGEPGTQMTLKTFHFAGVASMNVTLGVPRIKEIINASKTISTPVISCPLINSKEEKEARIVKGRIERTTLSQICLYIDEVYSRTNGLYLEINLSLEHMALLKLQLNVMDVYHALLTAPKLKLSESNILIPPSRNGQPQSKLLIFPNVTDVDASSRGAAFFALQNLKTSIQKVLVSGISTVNRAVINREKSDYSLVIEGYGLLGVMGTKGVDSTRTKSNHIMEVEKVLGIEAARATIIEEIQNTMSSHGMTIDTRHLMLLADLMTSKGEVLGITRFGIAKMKESVLMLASFEKTTDHLFDAAILGQKDAIRGVSECIIMGIPMSIGTGLFKLLQGPISNATKKRLAGKRLLFDNPQLHTPGAVRA